MTNEPFSNPAAGGRFTAADHKGKLLLVTPTNYKVGVETTFGTKDAVEATIVVLDEQTPGNSETIEGALLFGGVLIGQTKSKVGRGMVLGRLNQGTAKKNQQPPWTLDDPTDADRAVGMAYLASQAPQL